MKGTRLWQAPGSPIIQGHSRRQRPFWQPWLLASLVAGVAVGAWLAFMAPRAGVGVLGAVLFAGVLVGAAGGVWLSRQAGWSSSWIVGAAFGIAVAAAVYVAASLPVLSAFRNVVS